MDRDEDGVWIAERPAIPGCISQGETKDEATVSIHQAIFGCFEVRAALGDATHWKNPSRGGRRRLIRHGQPSNHQRTASPRGFHQRRLELCPPAGKPHDPNQTRPPRQPVAPRPQRTRLRPPPRPPPQRRKLSSVKVHNPPCQIESLDLANTPTPKSNFKKKSKKPLLHSGTTGPAHFHHRSVLYT
jgi:hypothetical protein